MTIQLDVWQMIYLFTSMENKFSIPSAAAVINSSYRLPPGCGSHPGQASPPGAASSGRAGRGSPRSPGSCCSKWHKNAGNSSHPHLVCGNDNESEATVKTRLNHATFLTFEINANVSTYECKWMWTVNVSAYIYIHTSKHLKTNGRK